MTQLYDPNQHHRQSIRLKGYDYRSAGAYFVTICTRNRECVLDDSVVSGIVTDVWLALPEWFPTIALDEFVVMPNHLHLIAWLQHIGAGASPAPTPDIGDDVGVGLAPTPGSTKDATPWIIPIPQTPNHNPTLGDVIGALKSLIFTVYLDWIEANDPTRQAKFWQRNYYEHIIRNQRELNAIRHYIRNNPLQWDLDRDNPKNVRQLQFPTKIEDYLADISHG